MPTSTDPTDRGHTALPTPPPPGATPPVGGTAPRRGAASIVLVIVAGTMAIGLLGAAVVCVLEAGRSRADADAVAATGDAIRAFVGPDDPLGELELEREATSVYLLGMEDAMPLPLDLAEARRQTDEAFARLDAATGDWPDELAAAYAPALAQHDAVTGLRAEVDAVPDDQRHLAATDLSTALADDYSAVAVIIDDATRATVTAIDDPELVQGAALARLAGRRTATVGALGRTMLLGQVEGDGIGTPDEIRLLAELVGTFDIHEGEIAALADGAYAPLADSMANTDAPQELRDLAEAAIATGAVDVGRVLDASQGDSGAVAASVSFERDVADLVVRELDAADDDAQSRTSRFTALALGFSAATALAVAITIVLLVRLVRSSRRHR